MAITLEANYSKKIGLPGYSSHQYSLTVRKEVADMAQVQRESEQLHATLQTAVDNELRNQGWLPESNGSNGNGHNGSNGHHRRNGNGNGNGYQSREDRWQCSPKQKDLILKIIDENGLNRDDIDQLAKDRFDKGLRYLNKLEASGLIEELIEKHPRQHNRTAA